MAYLTIRNVSPTLAEALQREKRRRRASLNQTVIELLAQALGVGLVESPSNGLARLAGSWSEEEHQEFEQAVAITEQMDEELWR